MEPGLEVFDHTLRSAYEWLGEIGAVLGTRDPGVELAVLRAALHALRDGLPDREAVALGAQLPMVLRGLYYEGWRPHGDVPAIESPREFLDRVSLELHEDLDPERAARAVCAVVANHVEPGEWERVLQLLPGPLYLSGAAAPAEPLAVLKS